MLAATALTGLALSACGESPAGPAGLGTLPSTPDPTPVPSVAYAPPAIPAPTVTVVGYGGWQADVLTIDTAPAECAKGEVDGGWRWIANGEAWSCFAPQSLLAATQAQGGYEPLCVYLGDALSQNFHNRTFGCNTTTAPTLTSQWNYSPGGSFPNGAVFTFIPFGQQPTTTGDANSGSTGSGAAVTSTLDGVRGLLGQPGICVFQTPYDLAAVVLTNNSICQVGTTDAIKGTSGQQTEQFTISSGFSSSVDAVLCTLTRPTDGKTAYVVDGGGHAVGTRICSELQNIGWVHAN